MRTIWKGAISFGLVHVPVKLYPATERKDIKFNYLHEKCKTPVKYERHCPNCDIDVPNEEIVKGYEYEKGKYIIIRDEDLEHIPLETSRTVSILDFVDLSEVDPLYFDKSYYLTPNEGGQKAFELLRQAMEKSGKVAIAKVVIRSKEALAAIRVYKNTVAMETMFYPDEIRPVSALPELNYNVNIHENELKMAENLISSLSEQFQPEKYNNQYREAMMELIQSKITGEEIEIPAKAQEGKVVDLMEALKASIKIAQQEKKTDKKNAADKETAKKHRKTS